MTLETLLKTFTHFLYCACRIDNIVAAISRRTAEDYAVGDYVIPAGSMVQLPLTDMAKQDPRWSGAAGELDPNAFNPDRLLNKDGAKPGWSIPFGHGPRFCVGYSLAMAEVSFEFEF
jgi:cytochrome P450